MMAPHFVFALADLLALFLLFNVCPSNHCSVAYDVSVTDITFLDNENFKLIDGELKGHFDEIPRLVLFFFFFFPFSLVVVAH